MKRTLAKERRMWRNLGLRTKEQRQLARACALGGLYCLSFLCWLAYAHFYVFRQLIAFVSAIVFVMYLLSRVVLVVQQSAMKREVDTLQDVDMNPYNEHGFLHEHAYSKSVPLPRQTVVHTDGQEIEVVEESEIAEKKAEVERLRRKGKDGNIDFEIE